MSQTLSASSLEPSSQPSVVALGGIAVPSWLVSILAHAALLGLLATLTWTVTQKAPEREFSVGIMVKKDSPDGQTFESRDTTFQERTESTGESKFVAESAPAEVAEMLPKLPEVDPSTLGLSGPLLPGTGDLLEAPDPAAAGGVVATTQFFGAKVWGKKFVYVIDRSASMSQRDQLGAAKRELLKSLDQLPPQTQFQVICYNFQPQLIPLGASGKKLAYATDANKARANRFLDGIIPDGGTEHLPALKTALSLGPDVIFFLTDAEDLRERDVKEITALNKDRARIHTIAFGLGPDVDDNSTLRNLAKANGGNYSYVDVDKLGGTGGKP